MRTNHEASRKYADDLKQREAILDAQKTFEAWRNGSKFWFSVFGPFDISLGSERAHAILEHGKLCPRYVKYWALTWDELRAAEILRARIRV